MSHVTIARRRLTPALREISLREIRQLALPRQVPVPARSRRIAALLALTFGWVGAHKAYLMRPEQALLSAAFCWTLIPALVAIAEGVTYLLMSEAEFARDYDVTSSWCCRVAGALYRQPTRPARGYEFSSYTPW